jgi:hypothetical protein
MLYKYYRNSEALFPLGSGDYKEIHRMRQARNAKAAIYEGAVLGRRI